METNVATTELFKESARRLDHIKISHRHSDDRCIAASSPELPNKAAFTFEKPREPFNTACCRHHPTNGARANPAPERSNSRPWGSKSTSSVPCVI